MKRWTDEEITFLKNNPRMSVREQAKILERSESSVKSARDRLKISPKWAIPERYSKEEKILRLHALMAQHNIRLMGAEE